MRKRVEKGPIWPAWFYSPISEDCSVFSSQDLVPEGWTRKREAPEPQIEIPTSPVLDKEKLIADLLERGIDINPTWGSAHMKKVLEG